MFSMKKILSLILTILLIMTVICACNSSNDYEYESPKDDYEYNDSEVKKDEEDEPKMSEYEAIAQAKDEYKYYIISKAGFDSDATLTYGNCTARYWNGWKVTLRGNILGKDSYGRYEQRTFDEEVSIYD